MDNYDKQANVSSCKKPDSKFGVRHLQTCLLFFGMLAINLMKVDMSLAIVAMTDISKNNTFDWSHQRQSVILTSYKWGFILSKIPGGELSARFGGKVVLAGSGLINALIGVTFPVIGHYGGWLAICFCRLMQGLSQGVFSPTVHTLAGKWAPQGERSTMGSILYSGSSLGTAIEFMIAGSLASYWGWHAIFYFNGIVVMTWTLTYMLLGSASPEKSKRISDEEKTYIQTSLGQFDKQKRVKTPWRILLTSVPFIALTFAHVAYSWGHWTLLTGMPTYLNKVLGVNIKNNGFLSALPYFASTITTVLFGLLADYILSKGWIGITANRKSSNSIGTYGPAILLIAVSYVTTDITAAVLLLTVCVALASAEYSGYNLVHLDMAPNHAGTMYAITGTVANTVSSFAPLAVGFLIQDETLPSEWRKVFFLAAGIITCTNTFFVLFGTSERQKWNDSLDDTPVIKSSSTDNHPDVAAHKITNGKRYDVSQKC